MLWMSGNLQVCRTASPLIVDNPTKWRVRRSLATFLHKRVQSGKRTGQTQHAKDTRKKVQRKLETKVVKLSSPEVDFKLPNRGSTTVVKKDEGALNKIQGKGITSRTTHRNLENETSLPTEAQINLQNTVKKSTEQTLWKRISALPHEPFPDTNKYVTGNGWSNEGRQISGKITTGTCTRRGRHRGGEGREAGGQIG